MSPSSSTGDSGIFARERSGLAIANFVTFDLRTTGSRPRLPFTPESKSYVEATNSSKFSLNSSHASAKTFGWGLYYGFLLFAGTKLRLIAQDRLSLVPLIDQPDAARIRRRCALGSDCQSKRFLVPVKVDDSPDRRAARSVDLDLGTDIDVKISGAVNR